MKIFGFFGKHKGDNPDDPNKANKSGNVGKVAKVAAVTTGLVALGGAATTVGEAPKPPEAVTTVGGTPTLEKPNTEVTAPTVPTTEVPVTTTPTTEAPTPTTIAPVTTTTEVPTTPDTIQIGEPAIVSAPGLTDPNQVPTQPATGTNADQPPGQLPTAS